MAVIPVPQTRFEPPTGNCFAACLASILECPLDEVPQPTAVDDACPRWTPYWQRVEAWLAERNLGLIEFPVGGNGYVPPGYTILSTTPRGCDYQHAVVARDGEVVWNPWPFEHEGLGEWKYWTVLTVLDPAKR